MARRDALLANILPKQPYLNVFIDEMAIFKEVHLRFGSRGGGSSTVKNLDGSMA
jgi:hypothetical protein